MSTDINNNFIIAVAHGQLEKVKLLLEKGADVHVADDLALRLAICNGHLEIVKYLKTKIEEGK